MLQRKKEATEKVKLELEKKQRVIAEAKKKQEEEE